MFARVVFPLPLNQSFLYAVPEVLRGKVRPGSRVTAPLGTKTASGFVVALVPAFPEGDFAVKDLLSVIDDRPIGSGSFLEFTRELGEEYHSSWGELLQLSLPPTQVSHTRIRVSLTASGREALEKKKLGRREREIAGLLEDRKGSAPLFLQRKTGIGDISALLGRMEKKGIVRIEQKEAPPPRLARRPGPDPAFQLELGFAAPRRGKIPLAAVEDGIDGRGFGGCYVFGPDQERHGLYERLRARALARSGRVLVLVPEISMTRDFVSRAGGGGGRKGVVFHGRMTGKQKEAAWRALRGGKASVLTGTRSGLFIDPDPFRLIILDGEHEDSFRQAESPAYDARRGAWLRARIQGGAVVFGSDRPTVEAFHEAGRRNLLLDLGPSPRRAAVRWVDRVPPGAVVSPELREKLGGAIERGESAVLFLNRRGYASSLSCGLCGHMPRCGRCDIPAVYHKRENRLTCRYCDASVRAGAECPACGGAYTLSPGGGTEALEEELRALFPKVPLSRFDADTASGRAERERIVREFSRGRISLLVGTQLLAYQEALPRVRFLGILFPEALLASSDYRASQKTFQAVWQMADLAEDDPAAEILVQTRAPAHFSVRAAAAGDYRMFFEQEIAFRRLMHYPPFSALAEVVLMGRDLRALAARAREFRASLKGFEPGLEVLGPAFASAVRIRDVFRIQVILKSDRREALDRALEETLRRIRTKKSVEFSYAPFGGP